MGKSMVEELRPYQFMYEEISRRIEKMLDEQHAALYDPELRDQQLRQIAKDLYYDKWTWNTMGGFDAEEHERIDKYIKELEDGDTQD